MNLRKNILRLGEIDELKKQLKDKKISLVGGCFDILHYGHLRFLKQAKGEGDILVVLLESDDFIRTRKKREPFHNQDQRAEIIAELRAVDFVILLPHFKKPDAEYQKIVLTVKPSVIPITRGDVHYEKKLALAKQVGARLIEVDQLASFSSSQIKNYASILRD